MIKFAFYGRVSTEDQQDPESSRAWQLTRSLALIGSRGGVIVAEFFDVDKSRSVPGSGARRRPRCSARHHGSILDRRRRRGRPKSPLCAQPPRVESTNRQPGIRRITHLWCNVERGNGKTPSPEYMRALLSQVLHGTPVPEELHRSRSPSWAWPASPRIEFMIALYITAGWVAGDPRYGDPVTRLADTARQWTGNAADDAMRSGLEWVKRTRQRRTESTGWWRSHR
jgi:hypothetical protein